MSERKVIIIGGGLAGVTSFYELTTRNRPALLLERESAVARGASFANGGMLHPSLPEPWNNPRMSGQLLAALVRPASQLNWRDLWHALGWSIGFLRQTTPARTAAIAHANFALAAYSTRQTDALQKNLNLQFAHHAGGSVKIFRSRKSRDAALYLADRLAAHGLKHKLLSRSALQNHAPALHNTDPRIIGALHFPDDWHGDARAFCEALLAAALAKGGTIRTQARVNHLLVEKDKIVGVRLDGGETLYGDVVLCAGVDAPQLAAQAGVHLPIRPVKGYSITLPSPFPSPQPTPLPTTNKTPRLAHVLVDTALHIGITPLDQMIRISGLTDFTDTKSLNPKRLQILRQFFAKTLPDMAQAIDWQQGENWCGLRPMSADGRPFIGASGVGGLWLNCGHGQLGWTMAVGSARLLAAQMMGAPPEIDATAFSPNPAQRRRIY